MIFTYPLQQALYIDLVSGRLTPWSLFDAHDSGTPVGDTGDDMFLLGIIAVETVDYYHYVARDCGEVVTISKMSVKDYIASTSEPKD